MEASVCFDKYVIKQYDSTITQYQAWYQFVTKDQHEEVTELVFSQDPEWCCLSCQADSNLFLSHITICGNYIIVNML